MQKPLEKMDNQRSGFKPFLSVTSNPTAGWILCSREHGKLCFEHLEMISDAQNNLPLQGQKTPSEVRVLYEF